jgi:hypothetical protein
VKKDAKTTMSRPAIGDAIAVSSKLFPDGTAIELVRDRATGKPALIRWHGCKGRISASVRYEGRRYVPETLNPGVFAAMNFPSAPAEYGSTSDLVERVAGFLETQVQLTPHDSTLAAAWILASWVADCLPLAPSLLISSPFSEEVIELFRVLGFLCRRSLHIADLQATGLVSLPLHLQPTLLLNLAGLPSHVSSLIRASNIRGAYIVRASRVVDLRCPKAIFSYRSHVDQSIAQGMIRIAVAPMKPMEMQREVTVEMLAEELQAALFMYRLRNHGAVSRAHFDAPGFGPGVHETVRALGAAIVGDPALQARVVDLLRAQDEDSSAHVIMTPEFAIVYVLMTLIHRRARASVGVAELTKQINVVLRASGEFYEYTPSEIGFRLSSFGLFRSRCAAGMELRLNRSLSVRVHDLARKLDVAMASEEFPGCPDCGSSPDSSEPGAYARNVGDVEGVENAQNAKND